jgi:hypothetical protein
MFKLDMVVNSYNPSTWKAEKGDLELKARMGYTETLPQIKSERERERERQTDRQRNGRKHRRQAKKSPNNQMKLITWNFLFPKDSEQ